MSTMPMHVRRAIADRAAVLAVDRVQEIVSKLDFPEVMFPEDLLELQHDLEDEFYREIGELGQW